MSLLQVLVVSLLITLGAAEGMQISKRAFENWRALRGFARNSVQNAPPEMCAKAVDLGFVMDRRLRTNGAGTDWNDVMEFVKNIIQSKFEISDDMTYIGAISFDQTAEVLLKFEHGKSLEAVRQQMNTWRPGSEAVKNGPVAIDRALQLAVTDLFTSSAGARGYDEILVLLTDGRYDSTIPAERVLELKEKGVTVIAVGIGSPDPVQLWMITGNPQNVFNMMEPNMVDSVAEKVTQVACAK